MAEFLRTAMTRDVPAGHGKLVNLGGKHIALFNVEGNYHAIDDTCTHKGGPLSDGEVMGYQVTAPGTAPSSTLKPGKSSDLRRR